MKIGLLDSRRLTGPNLFCDLPGAVMDVALEGVPVEVVISTWREEVSHLMRAMEWPVEQVHTRPYDGGVNLVIHAPIDVLYTACELNEAALRRTVARLAGAALPTIENVLKQFHQQAGDERNPALLALQQAAASKGVPFLWDDDEVSVGFGDSALVWPSNHLPAPPSIDWSALKSIPLGIVTGTNGKSTTVRLAASILAAAGRRCGITSTDYIRVGDEILDRGDYSGPGGARALLRHPAVEAVVLEVARGGLLRRGIGVEHADAALITNVAADHLGEYGINNIAEMAAAKFIVRRALSADAALILNVDDAETVRFAATLSQRIVWFGLDHRQPVLRAHLVQGGTAAFARDDWLVLAEGKRSRNIVKLQSIPITFGGVARYNASNALAALALCHVLGVNDSALASGLRHFNGDFDINPGRGNLFERNGVRIFLDFAHNEHGLKAISETVRAFGARRNIVLMGQAGDRTDTNIGQLVRAACQLRPFRLLVCELPGYERGREPMEVPTLIRNFALDAGVPEAAVDLFASPVEGVASALAAASSGDCLVLLALTQRQQVVQQIREFVAGGCPGQKES